MIYDAPERAGVYPTLPRLKTPKTGAIFGKMAHKGVGGYTIFLLIHCVCL